MINKKIIIEIILFVLFLLSLPFVFISFKNILAFAGYLPVLVPISGQSMSPTLKDREKINIYNYNNFSKKHLKINRGDLIVFRNLKTGTHDYIKRVVAVPGDEILIRGGYLYINGQLLFESYISKNRSTFGHTFLTDCQKIKIPNNKYFVLGDNRKSSKDSREIGLVDDGEIHQILPLVKQDIFSDRWKLIDNTASNPSLAVFNTDEYYKLLNKYRQENGLEPLKRDKKLETIALDRAKKILSDPLATSTDDFEKSIKRHGYINSIVKEITTYGFFEAEELMDYWRERDSNDSILGESYKDTGIAVLVEKVNGCEVQIVVQQLGYYKEPEYKTSDVSIIKSQIDGLNNIKGSWLNLKNNQDIYNQNKSDIDRLIQVIDFRFQNLSNIYQKMSAKQWLSEEDNKFLLEDVSLGDEQMSLSRKLNDKIKRENAN